MTADAQSASDADPIVLLARSWARDLGLAVADDAELDGIFDSARSKTASPGLDFAAWLGPSSIGGVVGPLLANAPTPEWLLQRLAHFHRLLGSEVLTFRTESAGGVLEISGTNGETSPDTVDACFAIVSLMLSQQAGTSVPARVTLQRARPEHLERYVRHFATVSFGAARNSLTVPGHLLRVPLVTGDPQVLAVLDGYASALLQRRSGTWRERVGEYLETELQVAALEDAARRLLVSGRALQKYLNAEGTTFSALLDDARRRYALAMLRSTETAPQAIATAVGLGSASALSRAVKRWTGLTPLGVRREHATR